MKTVKISVTLAEDVLEKLDIISASYSLKRSAVLSLAVSEFFAQKYEGFSGDAAKLVEK